MLPESQIKQLIDQALTARKRAYVPYSNFQVGAALLLKNGDIVTGCNIENAAYTPCNCAERTAFFKAVSEGHREFVAIAVVGAHKEHDIPQAICAPCGVCRQVMLEFCDKDSFLVIMAKSPDEYKVVSLSELVPYSFSPADLI